LEPQPSRKLLETALAHLRGGRPREALAILEVVRREPKNRDAEFLSGLALEDLGRSDEALLRYEQALALEPGFEPAHHNRGLLLARLGRLAEAEESHRRYVACCPSSAQAHQDLADVLLAADRYEEAIAQIDQIPAAALGVPALVTRGLSLACLGNFVEAAQCVSGARASNPLEFDAFVKRIAPLGDPALVLAPENVFLWRGYSAQQRCRWNRWDRYVEELGRAARNASIRLEPALSFVALHTPLDAGERLAIARGVADRIERLSPVLPRVQPSSRQRLRIGILSPDFRDHLNARLLLPLFELADRKRFDFVAYSLSSGDGSPILRRLQSAAKTNFVDLTAMDDASAAARIRADRTDILVDVGGHTAGARFGITARRPAAIQVQYLGFAGSLASQRVDYAIVDRIVAPDEGEWSEALVRLPSTYYLYDFRERPPTQPVSRRDYGLPDDAFVYCAFHKAEKISPETFDLWMAILRQAQRSVIWFLALTGEAASNLRTAARMRGVDPERLHFAPFESRERYLARQPLGDLMIDAIHHSAMTTACDALGAGLPVLTLKGKAMASRAGESILRAAELPELVAINAERFVEQAVKLTAAGSELPALRKRLATNRDRAPLFNTSARVQELERAFLEMHDRALRGEAPVAFDLPDVNRSL
jgi:protein O-GlcNAc transferase